MAQQTALHANGVSGQPWSFAPKTAGGGIHTQLAPNALSGRRYSFVAKSTAGGHEGLFTTLGPWGVSSARYSFTAKPAVIIGDEGGRRILPTEIDFTRRKHKQDIAIAVALLLAEDE